MSFPVFFAQRRAPALAWLAALAFSTAFSPALPAADAVAAPVVATPSVTAPVTVQDDGPTFTLANGIVTARINKKNGDLEALIYRGLDTMGHDQGRAGYWEQDPSAAAKVGGLSQSVTIDPATNGGERAEVSIKGVTKGDPTAGLTPGSPGAPPGGTINCDLEVRYTLGRGESGVHVYAIFSHPAAYGPLNVPESRYITKLNQTFDWISVDADRHMLQCAPTDCGTGVVVHAKEQRIMSKGVYKNSVEHKYSYTAVQYKVPAFGWSSTRDRIGVWFINPTIEYLSGGATKQELVCHFGDNGNPDPIILNYWRGTHFGGGASASIAAGETWSKVVGPMFVYVNSLDRAQTPTPADLATLAATAGNPTVPPAWTANATALWQDALAQARKETARWPYDWVRGVDYPHRAERGTVTGRLVLDDPSAATTQLPHLTVGLAHPDAPGSAGAQGNAFVTLASLTPPAPPSDAVGAPGTPAPGGPPGAGRGRGGRGGGFFARPTDWVHDAKHYQFWTDGTADGRFTIANVRPGTYTLHAFADGVLGEFARADITVAAGQSLDLGQLTWKPVRYGRQLWEIGYPDRTGGKFYKGDGANYWLWGWGLRYPLLFPQDITYTVGQSDYRKDWFFQHTPRSESTAWLNPDAKDPAHQRFGWMKAESLDTYPQSNQSGPWRIYGRGRACTWTVKFTLAEPARGLAALRLALAGADTQQLAIAVNGQPLGDLRPLSTNALRYNTNKSVWQEQTLKFDAAVLKAGENRLELTVPAGDLTSGVVYDYLRLEVDPAATFTPPPATPPVTQE
ncbi:MAG: polysaccharide lyase family protein [Verrucomicrobia bacterium]|nr:polysaccharide lyase family protein [Verrucomicrobiota bacterium]